MLNNNDGKAYIAGWIIKLLAAALLTAAIAWAGNVSKTDHDQDIVITQQTERIDSIKQQLNRIENKLDKIRR